MLDSAAFHGVLLGLLLSVYVGPMFFLVIETSIRKGIRAALSLDAGIIIADIILLIIAVQLSSQITGWLQDRMAYIFGGVLFMAFGIYKIVKAKQDSQSLSPVRKKDFFALFGKGFLLNIFTPSVLAFWFGVIAVVSQEYEPYTQEFYTYVVFMFGAFFSIDLIKMFGAKYISRIMTNRVIYIFNLVIGIGLLVFGIYLAAMGLFGHPEDQEMIKQLNEPF